MSAQSRGRPEEQPAPGLLTPIAIRVLAGVITVAIIGLATATAGWAHRMQERQGTLEARIGDSETNTAAALGKQMESLGRLETHVEHMREQTQRLERKIDALDR